MIRGRMAMGKAEGGKTMKHLLVRVCLGLISLTLGLLFSDAQAQTCTQALNGPTNTMGCWSDILSNADG